MTNDDIYPEPFDLNMVSKEIIDTPINDPAISKAMGKVYLFLKLKIIAIDYIVSCKLWSGIMSDYQYNRSDLDGSKFDSISTKHLMRHLGLQTED